MTRRPSLRPLAAAIFLILSAPVVLSGGTGDDAGSGADASNLRATATSLPSYGAYVGNLSPHDRDWYALAESAMPRCVEAALSPSNNASFLLSLESAASTRTVRETAKQGTTATIVLASPSLSRAVVAIEASPNDPEQGDPARPGNYGMTLSGRSIRDYPTDGMSGADAGTSDAGVVAVSAGCTGGRLAALGGILDHADAYRMQAEAGQRLHYSLATDAMRDVVTLRLTSASGNFTGPVVSSGEVASVEIPASGAYDLTVTRMSGVDQVAYLVGIDIGPPDPSGCRPMCLVVT